MKKIMKTGAAMLAGLLMGAGARAQPYILTTPSLSDNLLVTSASQIKGLNTAVMDVPLVTSGTITGYGQLLACAYQNNGGGITVKDLYSGFTVNISYPVSGGVMASVPDVILGNKPGSSVPIVSRNDGQAFTMAVGYVNSLGGVVIDYYDIVYAAYGTCGTFSVNFNRREPINIPATHYPVGTTVTMLGTVHMDVVSDHTIVPTGLGTPQADRFFVVYDMSPAVPGNGYYSSVWANYGGQDTITGLPVAGLSLYKTNVQEFIANTDFGYQPDVAAIIYDTSDVNHPLRINLPTDKGLIVFTNTASNPYQLNQCVRKTDWYPLRLAPSTWAGTDRPSWYTGDIQLDYSSYTLGEYHFARPRIDANKDHNTNAINYSLPTDQWKVVYESQPSPTSTTSVKGMGDAASGSATAYSGFIDLTSITSPLTPPVSYDHFIPTVAYGVNGYNGLTSSADIQYMVSMDTHVPGFGEYNMMLPIELGAPTTIVPDPSANQSYFVVDSTFPEDMGSTLYGNAVSTPVNNVSDGYVNTWAMYDPTTTGGYKIYYKQNLYAPSGTGYAYRHAAGTAAVARADEEIRVYPNPTNARVTIMNPAGVAADRYTVTDVLGRRMADGALATGGNTVVVSDYAPGSYVVTLYKDGVTRGSQLFTKK